MNTPISKHLIKTVVRDLMPEKIDWDSFADYEKEDNTAGSQTLACSGDSCEIVDLT